MVNFTNAEMADMHFMYGRANGNSLEACRLYTEMYPNRRPPHHSTFTRLHQRLHESGTFEKRSLDTGRHRHIRTPELEVAVLNIIEAQPETSTRKIAAELNTCASTVWRILKEQQLYPYHIQRVQALLPRDFEPRMTFSQWFHQMNMENPFFCSKILFSDEASFSRDAIQNFHNRHVWAEENPHSVIESRHQYQFSVNVWIGIVDEHLIGPHFLPLRLTGESRCITCMMVLQHISA